MLNLPKSLKHRLFTFFLKDDVLKFLRFFRKKKIVTAVTIWILVFSFLWFDYSNTLKTLKKYVFFYDPNLKFGKTKMDI